MNIFTVIRNNLEILDSTFNQKCQNVKKLRKNSSLISHLHGILKCMSHYDQPGWKKRYFIISDQYLIAWCNTHEKIKGSIQAWQSHIVLLHDMGLIKRVRPSATSTDNKLVQLYKKAQEAGRVAVTLWTVPEYTDEVLSNASEILGQYIDAKVRLSHIGKTDVIRIRGNDRADKLYLNSRSISPDEKRVYVLMYKTLQDMIQSKGYARVDEWQKSAFRKVWREFKLGKSKLNSVNIDSVDPDDPILISQRRIVNIFNKLRSARTMLIKSMGYYYRPACSAEKIKYDLDDRKWIITKDQPEKTVNAKKKRGRPKKVGRPKGSTKQKKRGRPKGSKNKPKESEE